MDMDWSDLRNWSEYTKFLIGLLALANPIKSVPILLSLTEDFSDSETNTVLNASVLTFTVTLFLFLYLGRYVLDLFGITVAAFRIAGGIIFIFYALDMLGLIHIPAAPKNGISKNALPLGITPLGVPQLAGPGCITTVILYGSIHPSLAHKFLVMAVILSVALIIFLLFRISLLMKMESGSTTLGIMNKIMGLLLAAIGVEFILDGIVAHFPQIVSIH
jgi:MarC family membrane protein